MLVLAAFEPELLALDARFERDTVGVGLVEAALGTADVLARRQPKHVILVGTVGAFRGSGLVIGEVVHASSVLLAAPSGAIVDAMPSSLEADVANVHHTRAACVATTLAITTDDDIASAFAKRTGADVEHLEAFAVARACARASVRFSAVFGVANFVGSTGRAEWLANHVSAAAAACDALRNPTTAPSQA